MRISRSASGWLHSRPRRRRLRQYEHTPLVQIHGWSDVPRDRPLFDTLMVFENYPTDKALAQQLSLGGGGSLRIVGVKSFEQTNYALDLRRGRLERADAEDILQPRGVRRRDRSQGCSAT